MVLRRNAYFRRIDSVVGTIEKDHSDSLDRVSNHRTLHLHVFESLFDGRDVVRRNVVTQHGVDELLGHALALINRLKTTSDSGVLTSTTRLLLESVIEFDLLQNGLTEVDTRLSECYRQFVLSSHSLDVDFKMEFSHTSNQSFVGFRILTRN